MDSGPKRIGEALNRVIERTGLPRPAGREPEAVEVLDLMPEGLAKDLGLAPAASGREDSKNVSTAVLADDIPQTQCVTLGPPPPFAQ